MARPNWPQAASLGILAVMGLALVGLFVLLLVQAGQPQPAGGCGDPPPRIGPVKPPAIIAAAGIVAFLLGRLAGYWRQGGVALRGRPTTLADERPSHRFSIAFVQSVLTAFLVIVVVLLAYETYSLANPPLWPITYYVRCANDSSPLATVGGAFVICFLLGQWLWYPWKEEDRD